MKTTQEVTVHFEQFQEFKLDEHDLLAIRGGDGPEIDPDPEPIIVPEEG